MRVRSILFIIFTFLVAFLLTIVKLPTWTDFWRPAWVPLIICYWVLVLPHHINLGTAWVAGIFLDIFSGSVLGEHALGLTIIAYLIVKFHRQIRMFPEWQQAFTMMLLIVIYEFEIFWVQGIIGQNNIGWFILTAPFSSFLLWPLISILLKPWRMHYRIYQR